MTQGKVQHKKSNQGFASAKYDADTKHSAQSIGGQAKVAKGFAKMNPERRKEISRKGGKA